MRQRRRRIQIEGVNEVIAIERREKRRIRVRGKSGESLESFDFLQIDDLFLLKVLDDELFALEGDGFLDFTKQIILGGIEGRLFRGVLNIGDSGEPWEESFSSFSGLSSTGFGLNSPSSLNFGSSLSSKKSSDTK
ncbi:hypothetical protein RJT34_13176 [Clitoria ternatea]|uniref:Uncharacterized protein n=1 Tax=Clitoria ternatea TaxID=43366 RepID=A0AAN9JN46_CLITE